ncbi:tRNA3(Ser)-specific nuclease WapA precursor [compost metagenome]
MNWPGPDNLFGYTGLGYDYNSGLSYARARYYKPELGRFVSEDTYKGTLGNPQSQNLYGYVWNNPINFIDPTGFDPVTVGHVYEIEGPYQGKLRVMWDQLHKSSSIEWANINGKRLLQIQPQQ